MTDTSAAADYEINKHDHSRKGQDEPYDLNANIINRTNAKLWRFFDGPVTWFRDTLVEPNREKYPWYHRVFPRVPTIDKCHVGDEICYYEANEQFKRDKQVDSDIVNILRYRMDDCVREEYPDYQKCFPLKEVYEVAAEQWFMKYGELGADYNVRKAFMKQKHRLLWERRHGKVGTGMKKTDHEVAGDPNDH